MIRRLSICCLARQNQCAGLSTAAGFTYSKERFQIYFKDFVENNELLGTVYACPSMEKERGDEMNKTDTLLQMLAADSGQCRNIPIPTTEAERKNLIRSLMNIRRPGTISKELLTLQDSYLQEELGKKGIVALADIPTIQEQFECSSSFADKISLWQGDITRLKVGAIVNAANSQLLGCFVPCHRCIDNAVHSAAGMQLREECNHIMSRRHVQYGKNYEEPTGTATLTGSYNLPCDYVIHTVGPIVYGRLDNALCQDLQNCYESVLKCCIDNNIKSVAFCCISTGEFHFPNDRAAEIAWETVTAFLQVHSASIERIIFNVFKDSDRKIYEKILVAKTPSDTV